MAKAKAKAAAVESYLACASVKSNATAAQLQSAYKIEVRFLGGLNTAQKKAFKSAANRWTKVIVGDVPSVMVDGEVIDDLLILAQGVPIDGVSGILGQAGPTHLRPATAGASAFLPAKGIMSFDTADLAAMQANGTLLDVITHEMGHVIGIGTIWPHKRLLAGANTSNPTFTGKTAKKEYGTLKGVGAVAVPVENTGGPGTKNSHWRESVFKNELMSGFIAAANNPLSRVTAGSLQDLGYVVNMAAAEAYALPNLLQFAERGLAAAHLHAGDELAHAMPIIPITLPDGSMHGG